MCFLTEGLEALSDLTKYAPKEQLHLLTKTEAAQMKVLFKDENIQV